MAKMRRFGLILAAASIAVLGSVAHAEDAISPVSVSPERLKLAQEVMELNGSTAAYANYDKTLDAVIAQMRASMPDTDEEAVAAIRKIALEEFAAAKPQMLDGIAKVYARHFSEDDLKGLIKFYKSDAGKHMAAEMPTLTRECLEVNAPYNQKFMARLREYIASRVAQPKSQDK